MVKDSITFLKELRTSFKSIGAMCPSSPMLGRAMASPVSASDRKNSRPMTILEVGPGTGPVTRQILRFMGPEDRFVICELNHRFITRLQHTLQKNRDFIRNRDRVDFYEGPIQDLYGKVFSTIGSSNTSHSNGNGVQPNGNGHLNGHGHLNGNGHLKIKGDGVRDGSLYRTWPTQSFDVIVSTLPFSNFSPEMVDEILSIFRNMLAENGTVSFVEYFMIRKVSLLFAKPEDRARIKAVDRVIERWSTIAASEGEVRKKLSLINIPPALSIQWQYGDEIIPAA